MGFNATWFANSVLGMFTSQKLQQNNLPSYFTILYIKMLKHDVQNFLSTKYSGNKDDKKGMALQCPLEQNREKKCIISLLPDDIIDHVFISMIDVRTLHLLKCTNSKWKERIENYIEKSVPKFEYRNKFGSYGMNNGQFACPEYVSIDKQGNIYVSEFLSHRIQVFDSKGQWKQSFGAQGFGDREFDYPSGITINSEGHLLVVDRGNNRVQVFNKDLHFIESFGPYGSIRKRLLYPHAIAMDLEDNIYVINRTDCIIIYNRNGEWKQTIDMYKQENGKFKNMRDIAVDKVDGRIFISNNFDHSIGVLSPSGKLLFKFPQQIQYKYVNRLALTNCGKYLLVSDWINNTIYVFNTMNGSFIKRYGVEGSKDSQFKHPHGIYVSPSGQIIVCDGENHRIQIFE